MFRSHWFCNWLYVTRSRKDRRRQSARSRKPVRLLLESLEERLTPSAPAQTAGSYADLVSAISADTASNTNYVIQITNNFTFNSGGQVNISKLGSGSTLTLTGQNGANYTLTGNGNRLFNITSGQNVTFENLTLTGGGSVDFGGGIQDQGGNVTLNNVVVRNNTATGFRAEGGGVAVFQGGNLTIEGGSIFQSNHARGTGSDSGQFGDFAQGGGLYVNCLYGASTVAISDSTFSNNSAQAGNGANAATAGAAGGPGGAAYGGGVYFTGSWKATLTGDTFSGNMAIGGNGGNGAAGSNATSANTSGGNGGNGGQGGDAIGGGAEFVVSALDGGGAGTLTILNDAAHSSTMIGNSVHGGNAGNGGNGGTSTGTANNSAGGAGGTAFNAWGGGIDISSDLKAAVTVNLGNTTFYGNTVSGGNGGAGGAAGTGGAGVAGTAGVNSLPGSANGGGISLEPAGGNAALVNNTVANNTVTAGLHGGANTQGDADGGGIYFNSPATVALDNNTITQNTINGASNSGAGIYVVAGDPALLNNLIQGNQSIGSSASDLQVFPGDTTPLSDAANNFIGTISTNAVSATTNIVGNSQVQLGTAVSVDSKGNPTGGPIYYPLLSGVVSIGAGNTSALSTIASVEGTTSANATDEIGDPRSTSGAIDLGAVEYYTASAPTIRTNPTSQTVTAGANVSFTTSANGTPPPAVQWQVSSDGGKTFTNINGATSTTLTLSGVTAAMNGNEYQAVFTNSTSSATSNAATLTVQSAPTLTTNPSNLTVTAGQTAAFTAAANGNPNPTVQWQVSTDGGKSFTNISGATSTTLTLSNVQVSHNGDEYQAVFTNSVGTAITAAATLTVHSLPKVTTNPSNQAVTAGANVSFTASANGTPTPAVQWQVSTDGGKTFSNIGGATSTTLTLNNVTTSMNGFEFEAVFTNSAGSTTTSTATLTVNAAPPSPPSPPASSALDVPPLLALFDSLLGATTTVNANGDETITDGLFGIPLFVSTFDSSGNLVGVSLFGFNITFLFV